MRHFFILSLATIITSLFLTNVALTAAYETQEAVADKFTSFEDAMDVAGEAGGAAGVDTDSTVEGKVATVVNYALSLIGVIFLILMVYGGFIWMLARGDEGEAKRAKNIITMGVIGMIIVIAAFAITTFVVNRLISI